MRETTNLGLKITEGNDNWKNIFDDNADNMDALDEEVTKEASTTEAGRVNTGEQEFAGTKTFTGLKSKNTMNVHGANSGNYNVRLSGAPTDSGADGLIGIFSAMYSNLKSWLSMKVYGVNSQGKRINYYDEYKLPETAADKSANNTYNILTTKAVTLDASSQAAARGNISAASDADIAIMANGNTHAAIASGQAVIVRNHSTLADGLYWASTSIATNATLSTSNLTADANGGLNKLKGDIDSLNSNLSAKATVAKTGWGTQVDVPSNHAIIMLNANVRIQVWLSGSAGVSIWFNRQPTSGQHIEYYKEEASNTATFGITAADGTEFSVTRNGSTFSFTASQSYTIKALY